MCVRNQPVEKFEQEVNSETMSDKLGLLMKTG